MTNNEIVVMEDDDQKVSSTNPTVNNPPQTTEKQPYNKNIDLREISITLDGWSRTCDTILSTLSDQISKIIKNNGK